MTIHDVRTAGHLLRLADLDRRGLERLLDDAAAMKAEPRGYADRLRGQTVAGYFALPSTRTRTALETAVARLGGVPMILRPEELLLDEGEPVADLARVLSSYASALVIRTAAQADLEELAHHSSVPVINALTDEHHPCQVLADLVTLRERFGSLHGLRLAYIGDGNNIAHSLLEAGALTGVDVTIAAPAGYWPKASVLAWAQYEARETGARLAITDDPREAVAGAHAVYTDRWTSVGHEDTAQRRADLGRYRVDAELMGHARADAVFLHGLPVRRGQEVAAEVVDGPASLVWEQAANLLFAQQAVLAALTAR